PVECRLMAPPHHTIQLVLKVHICYKPQQNDSCLSNMLLYRPTLGLQVKVHYFPKTYHGIPVPLHPSGVMLVGDSGVGKTCLLVRFKDGAFLAGSFISTVGIDFRNKVLNIDAVKVKLQIWDTAGQERFRSVTHAYYRDADALLLLYDVTNKASFDNIQAWLTEVHEFAQKEVVLMLLGNKADVSHERVVKREEGEKLAKEYGVPFMETSAKSGLNVELAFTAVAKELKHRVMKEPNEPKFQLQEYVNREMKGAGCCRS
uniref:small monomeric GTPase n=1 Tax=Denticeps clupeoides TaxID=299321 RepID=A0AAY4DDY5_9TELE